MNKPGIITISVFIMATVIGCKKENAVAPPKKFLHIQNAEWLVGNWENISKAGTLLESWEKKNDSTLIGSSFFIRENDTLFAEQIALEQHDNELLYIPTVSDQNGGKAVAFKMTASSGKQLIFENPAHDFPQKISYSLQGKDSLVAAVSGTEEGKFKSEIFKMKKK